MKNKELIKLLQKLPPDLEILNEFEDSAFGEILGRFNKPVIKNVKVFISGNGRRSYSLNPDSKSYSYLNGVKINHKSFFEQAIFLK